MLKGITYDLIPLSQVKFTEEYIEMTKPFDVDRSAGICVEGKLIGIIGEFRANVIRELKLPNYVSGFELRIENLVNKLNQKAYVSKSKYPELKQDITLQVNADINYSNVSVQLYEALANSLKNNENYFQIDYLGNFKKDNKNTNYTFRLTLGSNLKTLKVEEVNSLLELVAKELKDKIGAKRI